MKSIPKVVLMLALVFSACKQSNTLNLQSKDISKLISQMTDVMVHDVTNPPLAARFFAYTCLAGYEVVAENDPKIKSMRGVLNGYTLRVKLKHRSGSEYHLAAILAMYETAQKLQPSGKLLMAINERKFIDSCNLLGLEPRVLDSSMRFAQLISRQVLAYAKSDRYNRINDFPRYKLKRLPGSWSITPPAYLLPVEPYFQTIRPLTLESSSQFLTGPPVPYSVKKDSPFYKTLWLSYTKAGRELTQEQKNIANFWDCNPFAVQNNGHMLIGLKKISPGAHWMGITNIACQQAGLGFNQSIQVNTLVSVGLMDCFICCWEEKYRTNRIRPETAIRENIDPAWKPLLQTPPFPEYISGHSVVSATTAVILTHFFGNHFVYTDNIERQFGIPSRQYKSFDAAAKEAGISRFWGGIHFMDAIDNGLKQGNEIGNWVLKKYNDENTSLSN